MVKCNHSTVIKTSLFKFHAFYGRKNISLCECSEHAQFVFPFQNRIYVPFGNRIYKFEVVASCQYFSTKIQKYKDQMFSYTTRSS